MNSLKNNFDVLEHIIFIEGLRIKAIHFHRDMDLMLFVLNNKKTITRSISEFKLLKSATLTQLNNYELISGGVGVHWPDLDEDLSLKGLLKYEISNISTIKKPILV